MEKIQKDINQKSHTSIYNQPVCDHVGVPTLTPIIGSNVLCKGYFQHEDNFILIADELRIQFNKTKQVADQLDSYNINWDNTCAIHFRLGDYLKNPNRLDLTEYYLTCLSKVTLDLLIICEDPENISRIYPRVYEKLHSAKFIPKISEEFDLYAMSQCASVICANSTFSWWGAWLGKPKQVFLPKTWNLKMNNAIYI